MRTLQTPADVQRFIRDNEMPRRKYFMDCTL